MKKYSSLTILGFISIVCTIIFIPLKQYELASVSAAIGAFIFLGEMKKYTFPVHTYGYWISMLLMGITFDLLYTSFFVFTSAMFILSLGKTMRHEFSGFFLYTRFLWFEAACLTLSLLISIRASFTYPVTWLFWLLSAPQFLIGMFSSIGAIIDGVQFLKLARQKYAVEAGMLAPVFSLSDQDGKHINIGDYMEKRHLLLIFVRGDWCPTCHIMLRTYQKECEKFQEKDIIVIAIGPDPVGINREMVEKLGVEYKILSDDSHTVTKMYGVQVQENNPMTKYAEGIPMPASFLIDKKGIVRYTSRADRAGELLSSELIFPILENLS